MEDNQSKGTRQSKGLGWFRSLIGSLIVGFMVICAQAFLQPWVAEGVKMKESILEQRYKACDSAINILQRRLASANMTGNEVPEWFEPSEKEPTTQVEVNIAYNQLLIYGKSDKIAEQFYLAAIGEGAIKPSDIFKFISATRKELGIDKKGLTNPIHYIFIKPPQSKDEQRQ